EPSGYVRIETGVREGDAVSIHYDPMIAKLVVWDHDRDAAVRRLQSALAQTEIAGLATNVPFLTAVASHRAFAQGEIDTGFIPRYRDELIPPRARPSDRA